MKIAKPKSRGSSITELPLFVLLKGEIKMTGSIKNKIMAVIFALLGYCSTLVDGDCIAFIFMLIIAVPMFFAKESMFYES